MAANKMVLAGMMIVTVALMVQATAGCPNLMTWEKCQELCGQGNGDFDPDVCSCRCYRNPPVAPKTQGTAYSRANYAQKVAEEANVTVINKGQINVYMDKKSMDFNQEEEQPKTAAVDRVNVVDEFEVINMNQGTAIVKVQVADIVSQRHLARMDKESLLSFLLAHGLAEKFQNRGYPDQIRIFITPKNILSVELKLDSKESCVDCSKEFSQVTFTNEGTVDIYIQSA